MLSVTRLCLRAAFKRSRRFFADRKDDEQWFSSLCDKCCNRENMVYQAQRCFSSTASSYIDEWFRSIAKPQSFYDDLAVANKADGEGVVRCYFYNIDLQGRLFLEETFPKNIATSIKDERFLNFFASRIRAIPPESNSTSKNSSIRELHSLLHTKQIPWEDYPFLSKCGRYEYNFIRPAATPIVFHTLQNDSSSKTNNNLDNKGVGDHQELLFAGNLRQPFHPSMLAISQSTGRLYHALTAMSLQIKEKKQRHNSADKDDKTLTTQSPQEYGLIRSSVAVTLAQHMVFQDDQNECPEGLDETDSTESRASNSSMLLDCTVKGRPTLVPIPWLPLEAEPGPWSAPVDPNDALF